jgi:molybdopterin-guanine dinucleotide biosynthesis protein A
MKYNISGAILAGGKSSRMGINKAFLDVKGKRIIDRIIDLFSALFTEIIIVTENSHNFKEFRNAHIVEDIYKLQGPLGGIYTGLKESFTENVFFTACDMPFLHIGLISRLCVVADSGLYDCVIPCSSRGIEPLCGIYNKNILELLYASIVSKDLAVKSCLSKCRCKYLETSLEESISFYNINTKEDLEKNKNINIDVRE